ncbi:unnamed protein product [Ceratitis capitata]|uniref:(Mediterranean fruit fly) hypothetical protein n=1 Tax=Ceratitis capitata TaxID=7213 RepID=A0A811TWG4_CERCA|nr:unnamed protein product [Ceratitis capitata]
MQAAPPNVATKPTTASTTKPKIITHQVVKTKPFIDTHIYQPALQQQQTTVGSHIGSNKTSVVSDDPTREIEEISKKISEHADALYHTWKSRGLAPTELLGFYTHAAAAAAASDGASDASDLFAVDDEQTAEGLQKFVNTFVLKDKEQRASKVNTGSSNVSRLGSGVVGAGVIGIGGVGGLVGSGSVAASGALSNTIDNSMVGKLKQSTTSSTTKRSVASPKSPTTSSAILMKSVDAPGVDVVDTLKKKTAKSNGKTTSTSAATGSASTKTALGQKHEKHEPTINIASGNTTPTKAHSANSITSASPNTTTIGRSKPHVSNSAPLDINLTVDLNLDLTDLSELQTHNLQKIKELLQENAPTTHTTSAKKGATNSGTKQTRKASITSTTIDGEAVSNSTSNHTRRGELSSKSNSISDDKREVVATSSSGGGGGGGGSVNKATVAIAGSGVVDGGTLVVAESVNIVKNSASGSGNKSAVAVSAKRSGVVIAKASNAKSTPPDNQSNQSAITVSGYKHSSSKENEEKSATTSAITTPSTRSPTVSIISGSKSIKAPTIKEDKNDSNNNNSKNNNTNNHSNHLSSGSANHIHRSGSKASTKKDTKTANSNGTGAGAGAGVGATSTTTGGVTNENGMAAMPAATSGTTITTPSKFAKSGRTLTNGQDKYVGRPILTRGSVAERVLMFEKCPDVRNSFLNIKRPDPADAPPKSLLKVSTLL